MYYQLAALRLPKNPNKTGPLGNLKGLEMVRTAPESNFGIGSQAPAHPDSLLLVLKGWDRIFGLLGAYGQVRGGKGPGCPKCLLLATSSGDESACSGQDEILPKEQGDRGEVWRNAERGEQVGEGVRRFLIRRTTELRF